MKSLYFLLLSLLLTGAAHAQTGTLDFETPAYPLDTVVRADAQVQDTTFRYAGAAFRSVYDTSFGGFWTAGWAISTSRNDSVGTFANLYGSASGGGAEGSSTYLVGQNTAYVLLDENESLQAFAYNNLEYTRNAIANGNRFSRPFGADTLGGPQVGRADSFMLDVCGYRNDLPIWVQRFPLADYRFADNADDFVVRSWTTASLDVPEEAVDSISFRLLSSDRNANGNLTPNFFVLDNLLLDLDVSVLMATPAYEQLHLYPNPTSDFVVLTLKDTSSRLTLTDANGRIVRKVAHYLSGSQLSVADLTPGQYYVVSHGASSRGLASFLIR